MFARLLAAYAACNLVVLPVAGADRRPETPVVVYLSGAAAQPARPLESMKDEATRLMQSAGYRIRWTTQRPTTDATLVVLDFHGTCTAGHTPGTAGALASTAISNGKVIPFASVDCSALSHVLATPLAGEPPARRDFLYGRAMARVIAHELHHILERTTEHARAGIARASFNLTDLLGESPLRIPDAAQTASPAVPSLPETPQTSTATSDSGSGW
jgi:hypothetical protein